MPFRIELYSRDGKLAGATEFRDVKVNLGVSDTLFQ
jgi:outer membrane lipoprotein-sorting protein